MLIAIYKKTPLMQTINKESSVQNTPGEAKRLFMRSKLSSTL